ncbi:hypothetical protein GOBAR_AA04351 [Gossypium barbadense]|uniref:Uncharacterized protein n=1 Tax=Gossypium barbadense TaxID=3634 RepID=A0A2P5YKU7_GOSBA|nr:hypothetical protein GOBAR_AA04351 [Gossypium barbadense]
MLIRLRPLVELLEKRDQSSVPGCWLREDLAERLELMLKELKALVLELGTAHCGFWAQSLVQAISLIRLLGSSNQFSSGKDVVLDEVVCEEFLTETQRDFNVGFLDNIKAHFNPAFEGSGGSPVPISDGVLDLEKHSVTELNGCSSQKVSNAWRGRGSRFKASGNSKVPLAESLEEMAN